MTEGAPDLTGRRAVVTGANAGIGRWTALGLARAGASVIMVGRSRPKVAAAAEWVARMSGRARPEVDIADFSSLAAVRALGQRVLERHPRLDILVNNAGLMTLQREVSADGYEMTFAVNHLAPFLLTTLCEPALISAAPSRIVTVASSAHTRGRVDFDDLMASRRYSARRAYAQSKLANLLFTAELARRLTGTGVVANAVHPGLVGSEFGDWGGVMGFGWRVARPFMLTPEQGARTSLYVAAAPQLATVTGKYFARERQIEPAPQARDAEAARRLWQESEALVADALR